MPLPAYSRHPSNPLTKILTAFLIAFAAIWFPANVWARDTLVIGIRQYPPNFHPSIETTSAKSYVLGMVRRPLTAYDQNWKLVCMLCDRLPTIENGLAQIEKTHPDASRGTPGGKHGIAATFSLPKQAKWGDGVPITTEDVVFSWRVARDPRSAFSKKSLFRRITDIDVVDDKTFTLHFDTVTFDFNDLGEFRLLPAHIEKPVFERDPANYRTNNSYDADTTNPGLYFGPYVIAEAVRDSYITLKRNPAWWGKRPYFDRIVIRAIGDTAALEANLLSGDIDMIAGEIGVSLENARALEKKYKDRFNFTYKPGLLYEHIDVNLDNPILRDRRVRQALLCGIDRTAIINGLFEGRQEIARTYISASDAVYAPGKRKNDHDTGRAAELLDQAGWTLSADGLRRNSAGEPLRLEVITTAGHRTRERVLLAIKDQWRKLGIDMTIRYQTPRELFGQTLLHRKFSSMVMYAFSASPGLVPRSFLHSSQIPTAENHFSGFNTSGFKSAKMDRLIDAIETELDGQKREKLWKDLQQVYADELPALPLYFHSLPYILPKWLKGVEPTGHQYPSTLWVENWFEAK